MSGTVFTRTSTASLLSVPFHPVQFASSESHEPIWQPPPVTKQWLSLMVLSRSLKLSEPVLTSYWLEVSPRSHGYACTQPRLWGLYTALYNHRNGYSPLTFRSPLEFDPTGPAHCWAPLIRFLSPLARSNSSQLSPGLPFLVCSAFRFSQPLSGLLLELP